VPEVTKISTFDTERLRKTAKARNFANSRTLQESLAVWWSRKYNRPPNHPLFLQRNFADLISELFDDHYTKRAELIEALKGQPSNRRELEAEIVNIEHILGIRDENSKDFWYDPVVEEWEAAVREGRTPEGFKK